MTYINKDTINSAGSVSVCLSQFFFIIIIFYYYHFFILMVSFFLYTWHCNFTHKNVQKGRKEWIEGRERESKHKERVTGDHYKINNNNKFD